MAADPRFLAEMQAQTALLRQILAALVPAAVTVPDSMLDGPHGDTVIKAKDPRDWTGLPMGGKKFSECPPDYLDLLAERYDYFARKAKDRLNDVGPDGDSVEIAKCEKDAKYAALYAKRARGWAARLRSGWTAPAAQTVDERNGEPTW